MAATVDKARFYLEQTVPELRELESKKIFDRKEIQAINRKRSDFEHKLNAPGSRPIDWARYLEYELNLDLLRRKRSKRMGAKVTKHSGPRRIFALLERATAKFHGDLGLWMQYLEYAKKQKAFKRINTVWTKVVRLHPTKPELWVEAGRYAFDEQSDMVAARSYMQRGLRFCPQSTELWLAYYRLELDYLARVSARARQMNIGIEGTTLAADEEDENQLMLPSATAEDAFRDAEGRELMGSNVLQELGKSPALSGAIPMAIFDAAMKGLVLKFSTRLAQKMFDSTVDYNMASKPTILTHIATSISTIAAESAVSENISTILPVVLTEVNTAEFARALGLAITKMNNLLSPASAVSRQLHILSARWIAKYLLISQLDADISTALQATLEHVVTSYEILLEGLPVSILYSDPSDDFGEAKKLLTIGHSVDPPVETTKLLELMHTRWPSKTASLVTERSLVLADHGT